MASACALSSPPSTRLLNARALPCRSAAASDLNVIAPEPPSFPRSSSPTIRPTGAIVEATNRRQLSLDPASAMPPARSAGTPAAANRCSASTTLAASRQLFWPVPITWIDINNIDACGWCGRRKRRPQRCGKRAASAGHAGTTARARFPRRWHDPQAARIPDGWGVQEVGRRRTRGNSGPGARPRGAGDGGDVRRDLSVR